MIKTVLASLLILAAIAPPGELPEVSFRAYSFDQPIIELAIVDAQSAAKQSAVKPSEKDKPAAPPFQPLKVYNVSLTEEKKLHYADGKLVLYQSSVDAEGNTQLTPYVEAPVPAPDGHYIAIISGRDDKVKLQLIPDDPENLKAGSMRFFNVNRVRVGLNFPGLKKILQPGEDATYQPEIKPFDYGQGQFLLINEQGEWKQAGGMRWIQQSEYRTIWFIIPNPNDPCLVVTRGIPERVATEDEKKKAAEDEAANAKNKKGKKAEPAKTVAANNR